MRSPGTYGLLTEPMDNASVKHGYSQGQTKRQINTGSAVPLQTVLADLADSSALGPQSRQHKQAWRRFSSWGAEWGPERERVNGIST